MDADQGGKFNPPIAQIRELCVRQVQSGGKIPTEPAGVNLLGRLTLKHK